MKHVLQSVPGVWNRNGWLNSIRHREIVTMLYSVHRGLGSKVLARWGRAMRQNKGEGEEITDRGIVSNEAESKSEAGSKDKGLPWKKLKTQARRDTLRFTSIADPDT